MAKEWLQSFNRSGQTGPLEDQGKFRQRKFNGVEQWHLEAVIKFLPNLLLLSVILFFGGIGLFLFPINTAVAGVVIAFSGVGVVLSGIAIIAGAISPLCPYQSAASNAVRRVSGALASSWRVFSRKIVHPIVRIILTHGSKIFYIIGWPWVTLYRRIELALWMRGYNVPTISLNSFGIWRAPAKHPSDTRQNAEANKQRVVAQAASWLLQATSNHGDQMAAAWFLRSIHRNAGATGFEDSGSWRRLLSLTRDALDVWESQPSDGNRELAEVFGLALCSMPLPFPKDIWEGEREKAFDSRQQRTSGLGEAFLQALELARAKNERGDEEPIFHLALLSTLLSRGRMIKEYQWANLSKLFMVDQNPRPLVAHNLLGMWAYGAYRMSGGTSHEIRTLGELMEIAGNK
ncbi:hypothetical protein FRC00_001214 [Tulasnella sp. 408]|nr:hypothetical protein FRC00_001214 [Tulasnella sp. 408]